MFKRRFAEPLTGRSPFVNAPRAMLAAMITSSSAAQIPTRARRSLTSVHTTASRTREANRPRLILVYPNWSMASFQAEDGLKDLMRRAEAAIRVAVSRFGIEGVEDARLALVLADPTAGPHVTFIGERTETCQADSPLGSAILKVVQAELDATSS
jgi:hypothetical protein